MSCHNQHHLRDAHIDAGLPHVFFELPQQIQLPQDGQQFARFAHASLARNIDITVIFGPRHSPEQILLLIRLAAPADHHDQPPDKNQRKDADCEEKIHGLTSPRDARLRVDAVARGRYPIGVHGSDSGVTELAQDLARLADSGAFEFKQVLHHDHVALHASNLRDPHHLARPVGEAADMDNHIECGGDLLAHRTLRNRRARQQHHHF
jgi:hypothetical protein